MIVAARHVEAASRRASTPPGSARIASRVAFSDRVDDLVRQLFDVGECLARSQSAISRSPPARPLDTCAARSPNTWSGVRTLCWMMSCRSAFGSPAS